MGRLAVTKKPTRTHAFAPAALVVCAFFLLACGNGGQAPERSTPSGPETFTFFDIGRHSRFSESLRKDLSQKLGNDAVERCSIVDLESNYRGFLAAHLPELDALNRRLNHPPGERVEHDVTKLMYRYARKKDVPFDYVELIFDGRSQTPLVFRIRFKKDETGLIDALHAKHGPPQAIPWEGESGHSLVWRKENDVLMASLAPDAFGGLDHHICIYFAENLKRWADVEQMRKEAKSKEAPAGKAAF
jgi:hypothetical protein